MELILDSCFLVAAEREAARGETGPALQFLSAHRRTNFLITFTIAGELACGGSGADQAVWDRLIAPFSIVPWSRPVSWHYGVLYRDLRARGCLIGANDLWIAATALHHGMGLVTRDHEHFTRVPGLPVVPY